MTKSRNTWELPVDERTIAWLDWVVVGCDIQTVDQLLAISEKDSQAYLKISKQELANIVQQKGRRFMQEQLTAVYNTQLAILA